jgi:hypothetical protein
MMRAYRAFTQIIPRKSYIRPVAGIGPQKAARYQGTQSRDHGLMEIRERVQLSTRAPNHHLEFACHLQHIDQIYQDGNVRLGAFPCCFP